MTNELTPGYIEEQYTQYAKFMAQVADKVKKIIKEYNEIVDEVGLPEKHKLISFHASEADFMDIEIGDECDFEVSPDRIKWMYRGPYEDYDTSQIPTSYLTDPQWAKIVRMQMVGIKNKAAEEQTSKDKENRRRERVTYERLKRKFKNEA